jgi:hypothetical protein
MSRDPQSFEHRAEPCELHPAWRPVVVGRLAPPSWECPFCKREAEGSRPSDQPVAKVTIDVGELGATATPDGWEAARRVFERRPDLLGISPQEEAAALASIDRRRDEEEAVNEPRPFRRQAHFTGTQRIEDGRLIQMWHHRVTGLQKVVV